MKRTPGFRRSEEVNSSCPVTSADPVYCGGGVNEILTHLRYLGFAGFCVSVPHACLAWMMRSSASWTAIPGTGDLCTALNKETPGRSRDPAFGVSVAATGDRC